jgi:hypothetical protein
MDTLLQVRLLDHVMAANPDTPDYSAMTVNERLVTAGLLHEFDAAARRRDRPGMLEILS